MKFLSLAFVGLVSALALEQVHSGVSMIWMELFFDLGLNCCADER